MVTIIWKSGCTASSQLSFSNMLANVQRWIFSSWLKMSFTIHYRHPPKLTIGKYRKTHVQPVYACIFHDLKRLFKVIEIRTNSEHLSFIRSYVLMLNWSFSLFFFCTCIFSVGLPCEADGGVGGGGGGEEGELVPVDSSTPRSRCSLYAHCCCCEQLYINATQSVHTLSMMIPFQLLDECRSSSRLQNLTSL